MTAEQLMNALSGIQDFMTNLPEISGVVTVTVVGTIVLLAGAVHFSGFLYQKKNG